MPGRNHLCDVLNVMVFFLLQKWGYSESVDPTDSYSSIISVPVDKVVCGNDQMITGRYFIKY